MMERFMNEERIFAAKKKSSQDEEYQRWILLRSLAHVADEQQADFELWNERLKKLDEPAVEWLKRLFQLGEQSVLANTNASVFENDKKLVWLRDILSRPEAHMNIEQLSDEDRALLRQVWTEFFDFFVNDLSIRV